jgi:hypothetical protein
VIFSVITTFSISLGTILFCFVIGLIALPRVSAQQPVSPDATSTRPNHTQSLAGPVNSQERQPDQTKVIRIYSGAGFFDLLLAEKLRTGLSKGFAASQSGIAKPTTGEIAAPAKVDGPKQIPVVSNL